ncbi:MAG: hypothetical protein HUJ68_12470 [Clostridia bacterium]|nr:hypothetical protein [Clostridia bacterium]
MATKQLKNEVNELFSRTLEKANKTADRAYVSFQCVIFYSCPLSEELGLDNNKRKKLYRLLKYDEKTEPRFTFPFYSSDVFKTEAEAVKYFPSFVQELRQKKLLPDIAFKSNNELDETRCKAAIAPLTIAEMELKEDSKI